MDMTTRSQQAVNSAVKAAAERGNPAVEPAHLAVALLDDAETLARPLLQAVGADPMAVRADIARLIDKLPSASGSSVAAPTASRSMLAVLAAADPGVFPAAARFAAPEPSTSGEKPPRIAWHPPSA